jgi:hypothetical protein
VTTARFSPRRPAGDGPQRQLQMISSSPEDRVLRHYTSTEWHDLLKAQFLVSLRSRSKSKEEAVQEIEDLKKEV